MPLTTTKRTRRARLRPCSPRAAGAAAVASRLGAAPRRPAASSHPAERAPAGVSGAVTVSGSSTVEPISSGVAEAFKAANPDFHFTVEGPGTGDGFQRSAPARPTSPTPRARSAPKARRTCAPPPAIEYVELKVALDGLSVMTSARQHGPHLPDLRRPVRAGRPGVHRLRQLDRRRRRSRPSSARPRPSPTPRSPSPAPARSPAPTTSSSSSSSRPSPRRAARRRHHPTRLPARANDLTIIEGVAGSRDTRLGWVGFAFVEENNDRSRRSQVAGSRRGLHRADRRDHLRRHLPDLPPAVHLRQQGQGRRERPSSPPSSTTTSPTGRSSRSSRLSRTSDSARRGARPARPPGRPR